MVSREKDGTLKSPDGLKIYYRYFRTEDERARIVITHGLGEHSGRYGNVVDRLLPEGLSVWAMDLRGHGKSEGRRGHIQAFDDYMSDLGAMVHHVRKEIPEGMKCLLLGHSMGGLVALDFALKFPDLIDGVIISSPSLGISVKVPLFKRVLGSLMSSVLPSLTLKNGLDTDKLSHDPAVAPAYVNDPLVHDKVSARWFTEILLTMEKLMGSAAGMDVPILLQLAGDDHLTDVSASRQFFEKMVLKDRTLHVYEGRYHEIYNEREDLRSQPMEDLAAWIEKRLS
ncbi:MAG: lysophospholipase [Desulfatiglandaceae bacterium]|jgi:alpha-beta hydrolase superfamily lysophospholipase